MSAGKLYVVGTPIGNLEDITLRALKILRNVDLILAEDTRRALKLLNHYRISKPLDSFHEHSSEKKVNKILSKLLEGKHIALISDAGMPVISDPGSSLVKKCRENNIEVDIIPGPSAVLTAIAASGFNGSKFTFIGFIPRDKKRRRLLRQFKDYHGLLIFFENPERLQKTFKDILSILGNVEIFIAREMTKKHQEFFYGNIENAINHFKNNIKGEITVILNLSNNSNTQSQ
ncbi:16S rRNA (cytidine(1402)-2'-O)-methyltransferase [Thermosipho ferrireducens]|uniref:Ribosomal RNA small subunit methyltransferase I n=1 Tax=Thermosipho ferrireducens TaxID=2571116 RepID=A0ABX7S428_9BACT|nr:16S rRNA (cytidine(1402)-2'-O)-methyltransferase [Thermosipho ferrireducens]QTA37159.1 16S rRNA (cytidine(1402)-2'-O)-methyltransferase [Thermosipho ferrireducens]